MELMQTTVPDPIVTKAAVHLQQRRDARRSLTAWARHCGYEPALHHQLIIDTLEKVERGEIQRLMIMTPPGSAKSTYVSYLFPPHFLAMRPKSTVLACSYSYTLIEGWGRKCRNLVEEKPLVLDMALRDDNRGAGEWETDNGGRYFCAGVTAGIAGHRAHLGLIDDFVGTDTAAYSDAYNDKVWDWYWSDFWPRLTQHPDGRPPAQVIICNHRHFNDLVGRLLEKEGDKWTVIRLPYFAEDNDILGRQPGERLWPEHYDEDHAEVVRGHPELSGLFQQAPVPETGDFFKREWFESCLYKPEELPKELVVYVGSDHAISLQQTADRTCLFPAGLDSNDVLWVLPDIFWDRVEGDEAVEAMVAMMLRRKPRLWWAEKGHISKSLGPFLVKRQREKHIYTQVEEMTPSRDKKTRAQSFRARMKMGMVRWPSFAHWYPAALKEFLSFPLGIHDDIVDAAAHLGMGLDQMMKISMPRKEREQLGSVLTLQWLKESSRRILRQKEATLRDY